MKVAATHEAGWEKIMAQGSQNSWKDEWLVGLFSIPLILSFCGEGPSWPKDSPLLRQCLTGIITH